MYHNFLIHSSAVRHLGCFHVLAIVNSAVLFGVHGVHMSVSCLVSPVCMPSSAIARSYGSLIFSFFKEISTLFSIVAVLVCIPTNSIRGFPFSSDLLIQNYSGYFSFFVYVYIYLSIYLYIERVFPRGTSGKEPACQCRRHKSVGSIPGSGRSPVGRHGNPLQYSCLVNPMDRGA